MIGREGGREGGREDTSRRHNQQRDTNEAVLDNRLNNDRWTSRVTTYVKTKPHFKKRRHGRPAKWWRDDLDKYWRDTFGQRAWQDSVTWRRHAEAFAQPRDTTMALCLAGEQLLTSSWCIFLDDMPRSKKVNFLCESTILPVKM